MARVTRSEMLGLLQILSESCENQPERLDVALIILAKAREAFSVTDLAPRLGQLESAIQSMRSGQPCPDELLGHIVRTRHLFERSIEIAPGDET